MSKYGMGTISLRNASGKGNYKKENQELNVNTSLNSG